MSHSIPEKDLLLSKRGAAVPSELARANLRSNHRAELLLVQIRDELVLAREAREKASKASKPTRKAPSTRKATKKPAAPKTRGVKKTPTMPEKT